MNKIQAEDTSSPFFKREAGVSVCLDRYKSEPFLRYARCLRSIGSLNASSDATRVNNSYFFVGFAFLYPLSMVLVGAMLTKSK